LDQRISPAPKKIVKLLLQHVVLPLAEFTLEADAEIDRPVTAIFGRSGAGKTSLLDLIAGLRRARSARIQLDQEVMTDTESGREVPTRQRRIGYVPQDLALFPHLSVRQNLLFGHKPQCDLNAAFSFEHVMQVLEIESLNQRRVTDLSGGERQRVALARALLTSPRLLLLDEPLASLDLKLKTKIIPYLRRVRDEFGVPMLYVTHDPQEAAALCDEVMVMEKGRFIQRGTPSQVL
jgi:molybdate transport system ATP-binding protein